MSDTADKADKRISAVDAALGNARKATDQRLAQSDAGFLSAQKPAAIGTGFNDAQANLNAARDIYAKQLKPLLDKNDPADATAVNTLVAQVNAKLTAAEAALKLPLERINGIVSFKAKPDTATTAAAASVVTIDRADDSLAATATQATKSHPKSAASIAKHVGPVHTLRGQAGVALKSLQLEVKTVNPNWVTAYDAGQLIKRAEPEVTKTTSELLADFAQFGDTVVKTLVDMKISCTIQVSRTSWNESVDGGEETYNYSKTLDGNGPHDSGLCSYWSDIQDKFDAQGDNDSKIGHYGKSSSGKNTFIPESGIDQAMWDQLGFDPLVKDPFSGWFGHDSADYNLEGVTDLAYWHQTITTTNGVQGPATWAQVTAEEFDDREYDLGMDIYERPAGAFSDEVNDEAAPAGMVYVGDPAYGSWQNDYSGNSYWAWYGQYRYWGDLLGEPVYRSDYTDYRTNYYGQSGYYGSLGGRDRWGSLAPSTAATHPQSSWVSSGGQASSVRGAGPSGRAGGPGGGGK